MGWIRKCASLAYSQTFLTFSGCSGIIAGESFIETACPSQTAGGKRIDVKTKEHWLKKGDTAVFSQYDTPPREPSAGSARSLAQALAVALLLASPQKSLLIRYNNKPCSVPPGER
jgi:hypothetical protein